MPARNAVCGRDSGLTMRLLVHVLARLAITATSTNSAAALDLQAGSPEISIPYLQSVGVSDVKFSIGDRQRRREREIKRAVDALADCEDRLLRDMGFPDRSQIEQIVRNGRES